MRSILLAAFARVTAFRRWLAPASAIERGWPKLVVPLVALFPFTISGGVRSVTGLGMPAALALALVLTAAGLWLIWPALRGPLPRGRALVEAALVELAALVPVLYAFRALYSPAFEGFPNLDGWDGGTHLFIQDRFVNRIPNDYFGFVSHLALAHWFDRLPGVSAFAGTRNVFYLALAGYALAPVVIGATLVRARHPDRLAARALGVSALVAVTLYAHYRVGLVLFHYNQAMGFYGHFFGALPLAAIWAADAMVRHEPLRIVTVGVGVVWLRFSYGLNLPDALLAVALVVLLGAPPRARLGVQALIAGVLGYAAYVGHQALTRIFWIPGGIKQYDRDLALAVDLSVVAALLVLAALAARWPVEPERSFAAIIWRALRFPVAFAVASSIGYAFYRSGMPKPYYYITKYQLSAMFLLPLAVAVVAGLVAAEIGRGWRLWRAPVLWLGVALTAALVARAPVAWREVLSPYELTYRERLTRKAPPFEHLRPITDVEGMARIEEVLTRTGKQFGGYLTAFMPVFNFVNAVFGHHTGQQAFFPPAPTAGKCVFWVPPDKDVFRQGPAADLDRHRTAVITSAGKGASCVEYKVPWKLTPHGLCHHCY